MLSFCKGACSGHYLKAEDNLVNLQLLGSHAISLTPSTVISDTFKHCGGTISDDQMRELARKTLISADEVRWYVEHLENVHENRKKGARKAAETRVGKKQKSKSESESSAKCGVCDQEWQEETDEVETWIQCEMCEVWFHCHCQNILIAWFLKNLCVQSVNIDNNTNNRTFISIQSVKI